MADNELLCYNIDRKSFLFLEKFCYFRVSINKFLCRFRVAAVVVTAEDSYQKLFVLDELFGLQSTSNECIKFGV